MTCSTTTDGTRTVEGRIRDKDGDTTTYTATVDVTPVGSISGLVH